MLFQNVLWVNVVKAEFSQKQQEQEIAKKYIVKMVK